MYAYKLLRHNCTYKLMTNAVCANVYICYCCHIQHFIKKMNDLCANISGHNIDFRGVVNSLLTFIYTSGSA